MTSLRSSFRSGSHKCPEDPAALIHKANLARDHLDDATKLKAAADEFHSSRVHDTRQLLHEAKIFAVGIRDKETVETRVRAHSAKPREQHVLGAIEYISST